MTPSTHALPYKGGAYRAPCDFSQKVCSDREWQVVQGRSRCTANVTARQQSRSAHGRPSGVPRSVRAPLSDQHEALLQKGFGLLKKTPDDSLAIARQLLKMVPNAVPGYDLETRALTILGRYDESLAVFERLPDGHKKRPNLRMTQARNFAELGRLHEAVVELRDLYENHSRTQIQKKINGLALARTLQRLGGKKDQEALVILTQIRQQLAGKPDTACEHQDLEMTLARHLQKMGGARHLHSAFNILTALRREKAGNRPNTACADRKIEMALAVLLEDMGGTNMQKAHTIWSTLQEQASANTEGSCEYDREIALGLAICLNKMAEPERKKEGLVLLTSMRQRAAGNKANTPCDDKDIELAFGKALQYAGGSHNRHQALTVFTRLRQRAAGGQPDTPCHDKSIELALSKCLQLEKNRENEHKALTVLIELRKRAADNRAATPCGDRDIEIALGTLLLQMGEEDDLQQALAIFTRLRSLYGPKDHKTPCDIQEVELSLAYCLTQLHDWPAFDRWNRERPRLQSAHEIELVQSIRYFTEFLTQDSYRKPRPDLLEKAFRHAQIAVDRSGRFDSSSLSQLGHCYQALSHCTPAARQPIFAMKASTEELDRCSRDCFDEAARLDPNRRRQHKDQLWRQWERCWLEQKKETPCKEAVAQPCQQPTAPQSQQEPSP